MRKFIILLFFALIISSTTDAKRISEPDEEVPPVAKQQGLEFHAECAFCYRNYCAEQFLV